eukprot:jgi/Bigna1/77754/fgenesh1_pg.50_\
MKAVWFESSLLLLFFEALALGSSETHSSDQCFSSSNRIAMNVDRILSEVKRSDKVLSVMTILIGKAEASKRKRDQLDDDDDDDKPTLDGKGGGKDERQAKMQKILEEAEESEEPAKFLDSEMKVHDLVQEMHAVAASPELFEEFVRLKVVPPLLSLLPHENTDISIEVVDLLKEFTEPEGYGYDQDSRDALLEELVTNDMIPLLVANLDRLKEEEEEDKQAVHATLGIFENLMEIAPEVAVRKLVAGDSKLIDWLLKRLRKGEFDENQLYSSEILSMILLSQDGE